MINTGKRTEWSPIRSVIIIRVIAKSDDREAGVRLVNREYDYRPTSDDHLPINHQRLQFSRSTRNKTTFNEIIMLEYRVPDH